MRMRRTSVAGLLVVLSGCTAPAASNERGPLEGAWRLTGLVDVAPDGTRTEFTPQENLFLFHGGRYSMAYAFGDEPSPAYAEPFTPTDEERIARFSSMTVNTGTYEVAGSTATLRPEFALVPEFVGGFAEHDFELSGDNLVLTWRRTMSSDGTEAAFTASGATTELTLTRIR